MESTAHKTELHRRISTILGPMIAVGLFVGALYVLNGQLKNYEFAHVVESFHSIPQEQVILSGIFCILSYIVLTFYDVLAIRYVAEKLPYYRIALASFVGYTFSHNLGFSVITGGAARYRLFSGWGLRTEQIAQAIAFSGITFWFGFAVLAGVIFIVDPPILPPSVVSYEIPFPIIGVLLLLSSFAYVFFWSVKKCSLKVKEWEFPPPSTRLIILGIIVAAIDWLLAAAVTYTLLPQGVIPFWQFVGVFQAAQVIALISHVPGGIGVFESLVIAFYSETLPAGDLLGILLAYRVIYYLLPLALSLALFFAREVKLHWGQIEPVLKAIFGRFARIIPGLASFFAFFAGAVLLISGATPGIDNRLRLLDKILPLPLIEASHLTGSIVGLTLLLLARGLQRRVDSAYVMTLVLLGIGGVVSLLKGLDYEEAFLLFTLLLLIAPFRRAFYRRSAFLIDMFTPGWIAMVLIVLLATGWIVFFSFKHIEYSRALWWDFSLEGDAPRALRALVGIAGVFLFGAGYWILSPHRPDPKLPSDDEFEAGKKIIAESPRTYAALGLTRDKNFLFSESKNAMLMFSIEGRSWISFGDPIGPEGDVAELIWTLREEADEHDGTAVFYQIHSQYLPYYIDTGLELIKIGEEAIVDLEKFRISGNSNSGFRSTRNKAEKEGWVFELVPQERVSELIPTLHKISDAWIQEKSTKEKGFSLGFFDEAYLKQFPVAIVSQNSEIKAFANVITGADKFELSVDLMRFVPEAPVMDYLFIELMLWGKEQGYKQFNLGMAPLSGLETHPLGPKWSRLGSLIYRHGEHFYNFQGVRNYKQKFHPEWQPRYLAAPGGLQLARVIANIATLISGGYRGLISR